MLVAALLPGEDDRPYGIPIDLDLRRPDPIQSANLCGVEPRAYLREATLRAVRNSGTATLARLQATGAGENHRLTFKSRKLEDDQGLTLRQDLDKGTGPLEVVEAGDKKSRWIFGCL